ncbi:hypothetical protein E2C01_000424 [Portunus trituberculatus]|uniref:Uncharacterized protein n=1 Tax=Portunus trituberculatus TaxID=210409 RepID=A0A5B7CEM6_PORTR|nr:hypothetical protein [Portunus trituberculatus]
MYPLSRSWAGGEEGRTGVVDRFPVTWHPKTSPTRNTWPAFLQVVIRQQLVMKQETTVFGLY